MSCRNHLKLQNFNSPSWFKVQVDSIIIKQPVLSFFQNKFWKKGVYIGSIHILCNHRVRRGVSIILTHDYGRGGGGFFLW